MTADAPPTGPDAERGKRLDARLRAALVGVGATGVAMALGAAVVSGPRAALSAGVGAGLAAANLWILARIVAALLPQTGPQAEAQSRAAWALVALVKMVGLLAIAW